MRYLPHTDQEIAEMLQAIGVQSLDDLFDTIPQAARFERALDVPPPLDEPNLMRHLVELSERDHATSMLGFLGGGMYDHHIPPAVDQLLLRSEFYTAYTPYQPEVSQGTLQVIWEFQTIVSELYGLPVANASMYDGASAAAEAAQMARRLTKRDEVLVSACVHPQYSDTIKTYLSGTQEDDYHEVAHGEDGAASLANVKARLSDRTAVVLVGYPSFYGNLPDLSAIAEACHEKGALLVAVNTEPYAFALCQPPGALGADIAVGEGQPLACPPQFGGPGVGLFACRGERKYLQQLPGRVCGKTVDKNGAPGFVLTLATREQHIRRERATSNICTNQGLIALALAIRASLLGKTGFVAVAEQCLAKAHYLEQRLLEIDGIEHGHAPGRFFNEFTLRLTRMSARELCARLEGDGIVPGLDLGRFDTGLADRLLVAVTEKHTREDLDRFVGAMAKL